MMMLVAKREHHLLNPVELIDRRESVKKKKKQELQLDKTQEHEG
jgi:hypothetical protein